MNFTSRLEKRIEFFEDSWGDGDKIKELYSDFIAEKADSFKSDLEVKFRDSFEEFNLKIDNVEKNFDDSIKSIIESLDK